MSDEARMKLLADARHRAHELVDMCSALSDRTYAQVVAKDRDEVIEELAIEFLTEGALFAGG